MPGGLGVGRTPANSVVLPFYATGAVAFIVLTSLMFISAYPLQGGYFNPHILAIVHTAALGWGTMVIFGASYQLLPVINERNLFNENLGKISYYFLLSGATCLITCFWFFYTGAVMIIGGSLIFVAVVLYLINAVMTTIKSQNGSVQKLFVTTAAFWLLITVSIGILLAINLKYPFIINRNHLAILKLHAHAGLAGWFLLLVEGIGAKLVPMFMLSKSLKESYLKIAYYLQNVGLVLFLLDGYFFGPSLRYLFYALMVIAGFCSWILYVRHAYKHKLKKKLGFSMMHTFLSFSGLGIAMCLIPVVYFSSDTKWAILYGLFVFIGWISSIILGMTFKTLPFIVWNHRYKAINGKFKIPLPRDLYWEKLLRAQFWLFLFSLYLIALSLIFEALLPLKIGLGLLVITSIMYFVNVLKVLTHRTIKLD